MAKMRMVGVLALLVLLAPVALAYHGYGYDAGYGSHYERVRDNTYVQESESEFASSGEYYGGYYQGSRNYNYGRSRSVTYGREFEREVRDAHGRNAYGYGYGYAYDGDRYGYIPSARYAYGGYPARSSRSYYPMYGYGFYG
jgi:hypothetical protein